jgi:hypothetical protein
MDLRSIWKFYLAEFQRTRQSKCLIYSFSGHLLRQHLGVLQIIRQACQSVIILNLIDDVFFASLSVRNLRTEWERLSENIYNNTKLQFELVIWKEILFGFIFIMQYWNFLVSASAQFSSNSSCYRDGWNGRVR